MSGKSTLFGHFLWSIFWSPVFTSVFLLIQMILPLHFTHAWICVDLVFALLLDIWWLCKWKRKKQERQVGFKGRKTFLKIWFLTNFMTVFDISLNGIHHINLVKIVDMKYFFFKLRRKYKKNQGKDGVGKMKTKTYFVFFSKARSI